jgi:hypothetical protein
MDDTTDKYCNYKTTDCTVASTKDLYKGLNFPKRFECPCKYFCSVDLLCKSSSITFRLIQRVWDSTGAEKLHLQNNELGLWVLHTFPSLSSNEVRKQLCTHTTMFQPFCLLVFRFYPLSQQFSAHLASTGMYRNYSLNTSFDKPFCNQF